MKLGVMLCWRVREARAAGWEYEKAEAVQKGLTSIGLCSTFITSWNLSFDLMRKDSDAGREWGQEEKGMTEDEMAGWHH